MKRSAKAIWTVTLALCWMSVAGDLPSPALAQQSAPADQSWGNSFTSGVKKSFDKMGQMVSPKSTATKTTPEDDPISLKTPAKPGASLYVAFAQLARESGKLPQAEQQYQLALRETPDYLPALLGYAELKEQLGQPDQAIKIYQRAIKAQPQQAPAYNNLGLCFARQSRFEEAAATIARAVQLSPKNPLYRNNLATVLVELGRDREAFAHLRDVHGDAAAYYNMGYLLNKKGQAPAALQHFSLALRADPSMESAQRWVDYLQRQLAQARLAGHPAANGTRITSDTVRAAEAQQYNRWSRTPAGDATPIRSFSPAPSSEEMGRDVPSQRRMPPPSEQADGPTLPGISYDRPITPAAPLPPAGDYPAIRPLPRVD